MSHSRAIGEDELLAWQKFPSEIRNDNSFITFREEFDRIQGKVLVICSGQICFNLKIYVIKLLMFN